MLSHEVMGLQKVVTVSCPRARVPDLGYGTKDQGVEAERTENRKNCILSSLVTFSLPIIQELSSLLSEVGSTLFGELLANFNHILKNIKCILCEQTFTIFSSSRN